MGVTSGTVYPEHYEDTGNSSTFPLGGFRTGTLLKNGSFEDGDYTDEWRPAFWQPEFSGGMTGDWTREEPTLLAMPDDGDYVARANIASVTGPGESLSLYQELRYQNGAQAHALNLMHKLDGSVYVPTTSAPGNFVVQAVFGAYYYGIEAEAQNIFRITFPALASGTWTHIHNEFVPGSHFTEHQMRRLDRLTIRLRVTFVPGVTTGDYLLLDAFRLTARYPFSRGISHPLQPVREWETEFDRAGDDTRSLFWMNAGNDVSKRGGIINFGLVGEDQRNALEGIRGYAALTYLEWHHRLPFWTDDPLAICWQNEFNAAPVSPNLDSGYALSIRWTEV